MQPSVSWFEWLPHLTVKKSAFLFSSKYIFWLVLFAAKLDKKLFILGQKFQEEESKFTLTINVFY